MGEAIVIYDATCGFCRWSLAVLLSAAKRGRPSPPNLQAGWGRSAAISALRPVALGTPEADRLLADLTEADRNASWHLIVDAEAAPGSPRPVAPGTGPPTSAADGPPVRFSAGAALAPVLSFVPGGRAPAAALRRFPGLTERGYRWVADHRGLLGRFVPERARRWADRVIAEWGGPQ